DRLSTVAATLINDIAATLLDLHSPQRPTLEIVASVCDRYQLALDSTQVDAMLWAVLGGADRYVVAPGVIDTLETLAERGHVTGVLSNCVLPGYLMDRLFEEVGIGSLLARRRFSSDGGW